MQKLNGFNNMFSSNYGKRSADAEADADAYYQPYDQFSYNQGYNNWNQGYNNYNQGYNNYNNMGSNRFNNQRNINNMNFQHTMQKLNEFNNMFRSNYQF